MRFKAVIVGAGPAGYFAAQALQSAEVNGKSFAIDMIEKLPTLGVNIEKNGWEWLR